MAYPRSAAFTWRRRFVDEREACPTQATMKAHPSPLHFVLYPALQRRWRSLIAPLQQRYVSVLARSDNAAAQLFDRHSANAAAQLADAQSEREATAPQSVGRRRASSRSVRTRSNCSAVRSVERRASSRSVRTRGNCYAVSRDARKCLVLRTQQCCKDCPRPTDVDELFWGLCLLG